MCKSLPCKLKFNEENGGGWAVRISNFLVEDFLKIMEFIRDSELKRKQLWIYDNSTLLE